ncbi:MFS transporter [Intrasporangium sp.]|uniref:MFS transporter n=1 Tax=Intrasporangium sp. TaxID=1925024 RepID=UPI00293A25FF|nr:MFS transporter [Intrasporangium sp.]MDV3222907.1 MFS transporter [Intrasporangium sp.]
MTLTQSHIDRASLQRKVIRTLVATQVLGGVGMASGIAVGALLAEEISGTEALAGVGTTSQVLGSALITIPVARVIASRGRRMGQSLGLGVAFVGAALVITAAVAGSFPLFLVGMFLFGGGTTANNQARYAAADLALPAHRGRDLSIVVWATTIGSVAGPNLIGPGVSAARLVGIPDLAGSFIFSLAGFFLAWFVVNRLLRPDPLLTARALEATAHEERAQRHTAGLAEGTTSGPAPTAPNHDGSMRRGFSVIRANTHALRAVLVMGLGHLVMVAVMVMTPIHMKHGHAGLEVIGFVISIHILGMYVLSPVVGTAVDRWGGRPVAMLGGVILTLSAVLAALSDAGWSALLLVALFLLGVGWSCTLVSGSTLLTGAVETEERPASQGLADVFMGLAGAGGGAVAGVVVGSLGYAWLAGASALVGLVILAIAAALQRTRPRAV